MKEKPLLRNSRVAMLGNLIRLMGWLEKADWSKRTEFICRMEQVMDPLINLYPKSDRSAFTMTTDLLTIIELKGSC